MKRWIVLLTLISIFSNCPILHAQDDEEIDPLQEEELFEEEFEAEELVDQEINDEFDDLEEQEGTITEENGPIPLNAYVDIAEGAIEDWGDRFDRFESYFADFDGLDDELPDQETRERLNEEENEEEA